MVKADAPVGMGLGPAPAADVLPIPRAAPGATHRNGGTAKTRRRGRPLAKEAHLSFERTKPWEKEGVSKATWYRRKREAEKGKNNGQG